MKAKQPGPGRPKKQPTEEKQTAIILAIAGGANRYAAAKCGGICEDTMRRWMKENKDFAERVECADAQARCSAEQKIFFSRDWKAQLAWLQAKYPHEWGNRSRLDLANAEGKPFATESTNVNVTPEELKRYDAGELARMYRDALAKPEAS